MITMIPTTTKTTIRVICPPVKEFSTNLGVQVPIKGKKNMVQLL